jgi:hypothetical protein
MLAIVFAMGWMADGNAGYPVGGSPALIAPIEESYRRIGGRIRFRARVERILVENGRAAGVCIFRSKAASDSGSFRPPIPVQSGHRFRLIPATYCSLPESEAALDNSRQLGQDASFERRSEWPERGCPCARFERS